MIPLPQHLQGTIRINWHMTCWCNYSCQYCPVMVFQQRSRNRDTQPHAFDYKPVKEWLAAFRKLEYPEIHLKISGGEPFMDRQNLRDLLIGLSEMKHIRVGIDTNGYWNPDFFRGVDKSNLWLNVGCHPSQVSIDDFFRNLLAIRDAGFHIAMINYVLAPENLEQFEAARSRFENEGFFVNVSTLIPTGIYMARTDRTERELDIIEKYNTPLDNYFKAIKPPTKGRPCFFPSMSYYLNWAGNVRVACLDGTARNLFTDGFPPLPREAVPCEYEQCVGCIEMYRALADEPRIKNPLQLFTQEHYAAEVKEFRRQRAWNKKLDRLPFVGRFLRHDLDTGEFRRALATQTVRPTLIPLLAPLAPLPEASVFGASDQKEVNARSRDRISISGWAASRSTGAPIEEVYFEVANQRIGTIRNFSHRPDVAIAFGRPELTQSGWNAMLFLPRLPEGEHQLVPRGVDREGNAADLPPIRLHIVN